MSSIYLKQLPEKFVNKYKRLVPPWGPVGLVTYKRTYSRQIEEGRTEDWHETVARCVNGALKIGLKMTDDEAFYLYDSVFNLRCTFSGRALWQLGTKTVERFGGDSLQNCWAVACDEPVEPFCFAFNELMLGGGVGFNIQREFVYEIPRVKFDVNVVRKDEKDVDYIVPDNREGWVDLLRRTFSAFFLTGKSFSYSTICVRPKGARINSFGGTASGPEDLCKGISEVVSVLKERAGKKLRPTDCLDIMNIIGSVVVAGNVRRSAQLALGDIDDSSYLDAKNWEKGSIPNWRSMSNNSVVCNKAEYMHDKFWDTYDGGSEPYGLINLSNCRKFGRIVDGAGYRPDPKIIGTNPCGELPLENKEACNLAEIFLPNISDVEEFKKVAGSMYKVVKAISCLPFIHEGTNAVVQANHRLGISVTGFLQSGFVDKPEVFDSAYKYIEAVDEEYSKVLGCGRSIKLTTVKPSGTASLLPGVTPGVHPAYAQHYIRRIRMASDDKLVDICRKHGYHVEPQIRMDGSRDMDTMVVSFPIHVPEGTVVAKDVSAVKQLDYAKFLQRHWSDNSVSVTVYYKKEELPEIKSWLAQNYDEHVKTVSFLLHSGHGFVQAPYEEISAEDYAKFMGVVTPITSINDEKSVGLKESLECAGGACPIK
jgi:adenosylcobalamin-dependent ribonucleoside-triphosphate reductase